MKYDKNKTIKQNLVDLMGFVNFNYEQITHGKVPQLEERQTTDILQAQADFVEAVVDEYNAITEG